MTIQLIRGEVIYISDDLYHRPADNYDPLNWNFEGIAEDAKLAFSVGYRLATSDIFLQWKPVSEFKGIRK
jgi:hypothetical protein